MIIQQLGLRREAMDCSLRLTATGSQGLSQRESTLPPSRRRQVSKLISSLIISASLKTISMLDDVMRSCSRLPDSCILFCDEMASVVQSVPPDPSILRHLSDETTTTFQDMFLIEASDPLPTDLELPLECARGLDSTEEGSIAVNLFPLAVKQDEKTQERGGALRAMASQFSLLRVCEQALNGSLEGVDALLGKRTREPFL